MMTSQLSPTSETEWYVCALEAVAERVYQLELQIQEQRLTMSPTPPEISSALANLTPLPASASHPQDPEQSFGSRPEADFYINALEVSSSATLRWVVSRILLFLL